MRIKDVESLVGVTRKNIRFYEKEGLLSPGREAENSYRDYSMEDVNRLRAIKLLRKLDMPISEIRDVLENRVSLPVAVRRHIVDLDGQIANIQKARTISQQIAESVCSVETLDVEGILAEMSQMEKEGTIFVNVQKRDIGKKYWGPVIACLCMVALFLGLIRLFLYLNTIDPCPPILLAVLIVLMAASAVGTVAALISRIKEIKRGEENDLGNY